MRSGSSERPGGSGRPVSAATPLRSPEDVLGHEEADGLERAPIGVPPAPFPPSGPAGFLCAGMRVEPEAAKKAETDLRH